MLGNTLYYILTNKQPLFRVRAVASKRRIEAGETSVIPDKYMMSDDPIIRLLIEVIQSCWSMNSNDRPSAEKVANTLSKAYELSNLE